jgi:hypothetical protein
VGVTVRPAWHMAKTRNWGISGGAKFSGGIGIIPGVKFFKFTNKDLGKSYDFAYCSLSGGFAAKLDLGSVVEFFAGKISQATDAKGNPSQVQNASFDKVNVLKPFSFHDLMGATGGNFSAAVAAIASIEASYFCVFVGSSRIFEIGPPGPEAKIAVEVNVLSLGAGTFLPADSEFDYVQKEEFNYILKNGPMTITRGSKL